MNQVGAEYRSGRIVRGHRAKLLLVSAAVAVPLAAVTSNGFLGSAPLYSRMRMSGNAAALENATVTMFAPAAAAAMLLA